MEQTSIFEFMYEKYKITKPIRLIELFAGYGSQALALKYLGVDFTHWHICEWATKSIQAYNDLHIRDYTDYSKNLTQNEVIDKLVNYGISMNYNKPMSITQIKSMGEDWQRETYNNIVATNNLVNIQKTQSKDLNIIDTDKYEYIMTYSFPCQDLSIIGKKQGMKRDSGTRSGMLWEVERILDELNSKGKSNLPQVLLMENVSQVIGKNSIKEFQEWVLKLESLGYKNYIDILNANDYGIPQNRERCFMISILGDYYYKFPKKIKQKITAEHFVKKSIEKDFLFDEYYLDKISATTYGKYHKDTQDLINGVYKGFAILDYRIDEGLRVRKNNCSPTIATRGQNSVTNTPIVYINGKLRFLSQKERFKLMGVKEIDYLKIAENQSKSSLDHLSGDSIVTTVLMAIFGELLGIDWQSKVKDLVNEMTEN